MTASDHRTLAAIGGETLFAVMLGQPIRQVRTPGAFNAWAAETGTDAVMIPVDVPAGALADTLRALRGWGNCLGAVVTYPHKQAAVDALDSRSEAVGVVGACNVIRRGADGDLQGDITDGLGFVGALRQNGFDPEGADVRLIGAGGAGSAIALALLDAGVGRLVIESIDGIRAADLAGRLTQARPGRHVATTSPEDFVCALVCNATPVGMNGDPGMPCVLDGLPADCFVADIVPTPADTPWILEARRRGHRTQTGPEMVAAQLPVIVGHLLGADAPVAVNNLRPPLS